GGGVGAVGRRGEVFGGASEFGVGRGDGECGVGAAVDCGGGGREYAGVCGDAVDDCGAGESGGPGADAAGCGGGCECGDDAGDAAGVCDWGERRGDGGDADRGGSGFYQDAEGGAGVDRGCASQAWAGGAGAGQ